MEHVTRADALMLHQVVGTAAFRFFLRHFVWVVDTFTGSPDSPFPLNVIPDDEVDSLQVSAQRLN